MKKTFTVIALLVAQSALLHAAPDTTQFLKSYCTDCHGSKKQKSDRRFDTLPSKIGSLADLERYQEIVDQLNLFEMPPEDEPQPSADERAKMIDHLTQKITTEIGRASCRERV